VAIALMQINRPPPPLPADVPPPVRQLIERALAKDPAARFTDGGDFAAAVRTVAAGGALADPTGATTVLPPSDGRGTRVLPAAAAGAALGAAARGPRTGTGTSPGTAAATAGFGRPVPPLQGPPVDGEDDDRLPGAPEDDEPRRRPAWAWPVAAVAVLALLGVAAFLLLSRGSDSPADTATAPTTSASASAPASTSASAPTSAATVLVDTSSYVGVPADQVQRQLQGRGLQVDTEDATAAQLAAAGTALQAGDVVTTDPAGRPVPVGSSVTLFVARDAFSPGGATRTTAGSTGGDTGGGSGGSGSDGGQVTTAPRTTTATTQPRTTAPTSSTAPSTASSAPAGSSVGGGGAGPSGGTEGGSDGNGQQGGRSATTSPVVTDNSLTRATPGAGRTTAASAGRTG
jgi:serine/threonine-protein kinase